MTLFQILGTDPPFRANLLSGMFKVVLSEPPYRVQPYLAGMCMYSEFIVQPVLTGMARMYARQAHNYTAHMPPAQ